MDRGNRVSGHRRTPFESMFPRRLPKERVFEGTEAAIRGQSFRRSSNDSGLYERAVARLASTMETLQVVFGEKGKGLRRARNERIYRRRKEHRLPRPTLLEISTPRPRPKPPPIRTRTRFAASTRIRRTSAHWFIRVEASIFRSNASRETRGFESSRRVPRDEI